MRREFTLEEMTYDEFNEFCVKFGVPPDPYEVSRTSRDGPKQKRYFKILDRVEYNFNQLLRDSKDDIQLPQIIWTKDRPLGKAYRQTRTNFDDYISELSKREEEYDEITLKLAKPRHDWGSNRYQDAFTFYKEAGLWVLRYIHIRERNFDLYTFDSLENGLDPNTTHAISGIYVGPSSHNN